MTISIRQILVFLFFLWFIFITSVVKFQMSSKGAEDLMTDDESNENIQICNFELEDINGGTDRLSDHAGKYVALNFFQANCEPCMQELADFERYHRKISAGSVPDIDIIAVDIGDEIDSVRNSISGMDITFPVLLDTDRSVSGVYSVTEIPVTYMISPNFKLLGRNTGRIKDHEEYFRKIIRRYNAQ